MSTKSSRTPGRSDLGESWVMASRASLIDGQDPEKVNEGDRERPELASPTPAPRSATAIKDKELSQSTESLASSSWTISGPELVMPSIYEVPISEASWTAPNVRSTDVSKKDIAKERGMRKRRKITANDDSQQSQDTVGSLGAGSSTPESKTRRGSLASFALALSQRNFVHVAINGLLLTLILHLLLLPELVYQARGLCKLPLIKSTYPESCIKLDPRPYPQSHPISPEETIITAQTNLESIFESSLETLTPLSHVLKESETMLRDLQTTLQSNFPDVRHALGLEFQGSGSALRTAIWEFDSLRADLRSAIDSLLASPPAKEPAGASVARDTRLAAQLRRRAEYLDRLRAQIRGKTDSLGTRFSTLDDHLEAVDGIVSRETRRASLVGIASGYDGREGLQLQSILDSLSSYTFGTKIFGGSGIGSGSTGSMGSNSDAKIESEMPRPATTLAMLRLTATHHLAVADSVERLSRQLRDFQRAKGSTWDGL
ncbi:hypothetical protein PENSTE_c020G04318 [Penicillium steckii]|uniref:Uncharacterized protein n=1 Tax=Penicillium steckii TaxID=303698 RepID=A0A1V6SVA9_9EURO|nr:hypothetical protein PENSTE_c020G04318 [Penicillium steckii]